ncbi:MAG: hypothetical protein ABI640_07915 [Gammaproteobacteria bacterium]
MRIGAAASVLFFVWCVAHPTGDTQAGDRACNVKDCFSARDVRSFDVIDKSTVIVYIGSQHCAFKVELRGTFCDLTYAPELVFSDPKDLPLDFGQPEDLSLPGQRRGRASLKVCDNNLGLQVSGGAFTEQPTVSSNDPSVPRDRFGRAKAACEVSSVAAITDDQVVEIYVAHRIAPPLPPMGAADIQIGKQAGENSKPAPSDNEK